MSLLSKQKVHKAYLVSTAFFSSLFFFFFLMTVSYKWLRWVLRTDVAQCRVVRTETGE